MDDTLPKSESPRKRKSSDISADQIEIADDNNNNVKREKSEIAPDPVKDPDETNLIDINLDCKEAIFQYLTFTDLLNLAEAHESLVEAAGIVFRRLYKHKTFKITGNFGGWQPTHNIKTDSIQIYDQSLSSLTLQHFGEHIRKVSIDFYHGNYHLKNIQEDVQKFCKDTLIGLEIKNCQELRLDQTFRKVRELTIKKSMIHSHKLRLFPNLVRLDLMEGDLSGCFDSIFDLEHLSITVLYPSTGFTPADLCSALCLNKQMSSLHLTTNLSSSLLQMVSKFGTNLRNLHLKLISYEDQEMIHFKTVEKLTITLNRQPLTNLQLTFDRMKELDLIVNENIGVGFVDFIVKHSQVEKLNIIAPDWNEVTIVAIDLEKINANLRNLNHLMLNNCFVSDMAASDFMKKCTTLKKFGFNCYTDFDIKANAECKWNVTKTKQFYLCMRT